MRFEARLTAVVAALELVATPALAAGRDRVILVGFCSGSGVHQQLKIIPRSPTAPDRDSPAGCHAAAACLECGWGKRLRRRNIRI